MRRRRGRTAPHACGGGPVSDDRAVLIGALTVALLRAVDYLLPKGRHWKLVDRWTSPDEPAKPEDDKG